MKFDENLEKKIEKQLKDKNINIDEVIEYHKFSTGAKDTKEHFGLIWAEYDYINKKYKLRIDSKLSEERRKATKLELYGNPTYNNMDKNKATKLERYGDENYNNSEKQVKTALEHWGSDNYNNRNQMKETFKSHSDEERLEIENKRKTTKLERYGNSNYNNMKKHIETSSKGPSKPEKIFKDKLIKVFGIDDVYSEHYDKERYPFHCDFYIPSKDLFIEIHYHWTHGGHPFDPNNPEDLEKVAYWESKESEYYNNALYTWTVLDPKKLKIAKENNLNIRFIYPK